MPELQSTSSPSLKHCSLRVEFPSESVVVVTQALPPSGVS
jgi:hypothetical protein